MIALGKQIGMVDRPNPRKVHHGVIPRSGGLAVILGMLAPFALLVKFTPFLVGVAAGGLLLLATGLVDDLRDLGWRWKLAGQIAASFLSVYLSGLEFDRPVEFWPGYLWDLDSSASPDGPLPGGGASTASTWRMVWTAWQAACVCSSSPVPASGLSRPELPPNRALHLYHWRPHASSLQHPSCLVFLGIPAAVPGFLVGMAMICLTHGSKPALRPVSLSHWGPGPRHAGRHDGTVLEKRPLFKPDQRHLHHKMLRLGSSTISGDYRVRRAAGHDSHRLGACVSIPTTCSSGSIWRSWDWP